MSHSKGQDCDYTLPSHSISNGSEPLVLRHIPCGHADLSSHGTNELVEAVKSCINAPHHPGPAMDLLELVTDILHTVDFRLADALTVFGPSIQQWCPILLEDEILGNCDYKVDEPVNASDGPGDPVLWTCLWLVTRKPCSIHEHMGVSGSYAALKQILALLQSSEVLDMSVLQVGLLIAVYETGHGLRQQAFQSLASCTATFTFLELEATRKQDSEALENLSWLKASLLMIDRYVLDL